jgi:phosphoglycerate dehydrogenase-like enzyme
MFYSSLKIGVERIMLKITMLQNATMTSKIFSIKSISDIEKIGELTVNEDTTDPTPLRVKELIRGADYVITSWGCPPLTADILESAPNLKAVIHAAGSIKGIVTPEFTQKGIRISNSAGPLGQGVAEYALGLTIVSLKNAWNLSNDTKAGLWTENVAQVQELEDITIGVVGAGHAGRHYLQLLKNFNVDLLLFDPTLTTEQVGILGARKVSLEELAQESDVISIHAPSIPQTNHLFNERIFSLMKTGAILVNTARGSIIDEEALINTMEKGKLKYACIDVTDPEPPNIESKLRHINNIILTPHVAGLAGNGLKRIGKHVANELHLINSNKTMVGEIDQNSLSEQA